MASALPVETARMAAVAREANERLIRVQAALERARAVLDEETLIDLNWKEAGLLGNKLRAALTVTNP